MRRRGAAALLAAAVAGAMLLSGCRPGAADGHTPTTPAAGPPDTAQLDEIESTLDAIEREVDAADRPEPTR